MTFNRYVDCRTRLCVTFKFDRVFVSVLSFLRKSHHFVVVQLYNKIRKDYHQYSIMYFTYLDKSMYTSNRVKITVKVKINLKSRKVDLASKLYAVQKCQEVVVGHIFIVKKIED